MVLDRCPHTRGRVRQLAQDTRFLEPLVQRSERYEQFERYEQSEQSEPGTSCGLGASEFQHTGIRFFQGFPPSRRPAVTIPIAGLRFKNDRTPASARTRIARGAREVATETPLDLHRIRGGFSVRPRKIQDELRSATSERDRPRAVAPPFGTITSINLRKRTIAFQKDNSPVHK